MALRQTYSRRKRQADESDDIFQYDYMSDKLINQILFILRRVSNIRANKTRASNLEIYGQLVEFFRMELGVLVLCDGYNRTSKEEFEEWYRSSAELDHALDGLELVDGLIGETIAAYDQRRYSTANHNSNLRALREELNERMLEERFGYQLEDGQIVRMDSKFIHKEIVVPALSILSCEKYRSANQEFREAHRLYREKDYRKAIHQCGNAFESVLKVISNERGWGLDTDRDTAQRYLEKVFNEGLIPKYIQGELTGLTAVLKSGVTTIRNKAGGHGEGTDFKPIPEHIAAFQLHQTAAAILMLATAHSG